MELDVLSFVQERSLKKKKGELQGKHVLVRVDVNTPLNSSKKITNLNDWRIQKIIPLLSFLKKEGAKVVLLAHQGRDPKESLLPISQYLQSSFPHTFNNWDNLQKNLTSLNEGEILFLENIRSFPEEKKNDPSFLSPLIEWADLYVNEAFSVSHRKHASVCAITKELPVYFGFQFIREIEELLSFQRKEKSKILILGGSKFGTKLPLIEKMLSKIEYLLLGGALANLFLKERGFEIGRSFVDDSVDISHIVNNQKIILPVDYVDEYGDVAGIYDVGKEHSILDIGPETERIFGEIIFNVSSVLWNGPMGKYEDGYISGSVEIAHSIAKSDAYSISGGGDTSTLLLKERIIHEFNFVSTGGGAMLDFLVEETLPAIECAKDSPFLSSKK